MQLKRKIVVFVLLLTLGILGGCGDPVLHASDASIQAMFAHNKPRLETLVNMAVEDQVQVLWLRTHENQPSDVVLNEERWAAYDSVAANTGVRSVHNSEAGVEMSLGFDSDQFMKEGMVKGILFTRRAVSPMQASLDDGITPELANAGVKTAYKQLATDWYLFIHHE